MKTNSNKYIFLLVISIISTIAWFFKPEAIQTNSWHVLVIFLATIAFIMFNVLPLGLIGICSIAVFILTNASGSINILITMQEVLNTFSNETIWLVVIAFFITQGFVKTGLGERIALLMIKHFGKNTLGLSYGLALADLFISPITPSNTARCGGIIYPITKSICESFLVNIQKNNKTKIRKFLLLSIMNMNNLTSALFVTAYTANPLIIQIASDYSINISWSHWFIAALLPVTIAFILVPIAIYFLIRPNIEEMPEVSQYANKQLQLIGKLSIDEIILCFTFALLLCLWIFSNFLNINIIIVAFLGVSILIVFKILTWKDILNNKQAWETLAWYSAILMLVNFLSKFGFIQYIGNLLSIYFENINVHWLISLIILNAIYNYIHYFFASGIAQVISLYGIFLAIGINLGIPAYPAALILAFSSSLFCTLTQYSHAKGPILYSSKYINSKQWWMFNFLINALNQAIFVIVGIAWWKMLGFY